MIVVEKVRKTHRGVPCVDNVSFEAPPGMITGLVGPSGAGKSSLMRIMCDLDRPDSGRVTLGGRRYRDHLVPMRVIGAQFEGSGAHPSRTARDHLRWVARANGFPKRRAKEALELAGLEPSAWGRRVKTFSLGMQQRLGIATALLGDPEILIFDEPANGLDPIGIKWLRELLRDLADEGRTVLLSSHLMGEMEMVADCVVFMNKSRCLGEGDVPSLIREHGSLENAFFSMIDDHQGKE